MKCHTNKQVHTSNVTETTQNEMSYTGIYFIIRKTTIDLAFGFGFLSYNAIAG